MSAPTNDPDHRGERGWRGFSAWVTQHREAVALIGVLIGAGWTVFVYLSPPNQSASDVSSKDVVSQDGATSTVDAGGLTGDGDEDTRQVEQQSSESAWSDARFGASFASTLAKIPEPFRSHLKSNPNQLDSSKLVTYVRLSPDQVMALAITASDITQDDRLTAEKKCRLRSLAAIQESAGVNIEAIEQLVHGRIIEEIRTESAGRVTGWPRLASWVSADKQRLFSCFGKVFE